jgi:molecular chaperone DnaK (HSP70)
MLSWKETAEAFLGNTIKDFVMTALAYFNDVQCQTTKDVSVIIGLNVARIINELITAVTTLGKLRRECEHAKRALSNQH